MVCSALLCFVEVVKLQVCLNQLPELQKHPQSRLIKHNKAMCIVSDLSLCLFII